ncbi:hypothetical protein QQS21_005118 [Conoideocrella luteorostrata]|uniref:Uncharacterized protein n=1 Tax=Conoideocrella luteorostrata TaxID=1105319 RepID=A0AAJ0CUC1_9HYPO|nr:hypothetical protein QQS21_005118 [Conoideocrella luteorostrata]
MSNPPPPRPKTFLTFSGPKSRPGPLTFGKSSEAVKARMRDRQARGKNPYGADSESEYDEDGYEADEEALKLVSDSCLRRETFEERERRGYAISVLDSPEQLMMHAQSTGDSIPGQRHRFAAMLCGFEDPRGTPPTEDTKTARAGTKRKSTETST